ncbi:MAG: hypothetical protein KC800_21700, partial [Candidatus Eremiobacteraeota bacterium]|nr:hypothetical protein [Candidatus Eremiobacteraeota bacterium]
MNIKKLVRNWVGITKRGVPLRGRYAEEKLKDFFQDVRSLDNSELDLDPRPDRVLFLKKNRWWQPKNRTQACEYSLNPRGSLGLREIIQLTEYPSLAFAYDYTGISYDQRDQFGLQVDHLIIRDEMNGRGSTLNRQNRDPDRPNSPPAGEVVGEAREDSLLLKMISAKSDKPLRDRLLELQARVPKGGWETPTPHDCAPIASVRDRRVDSMVELASRENRHFGAAQVEESVLYRNRTYRTEETLVRPGRGETHRSNYKSVKEYWRSVVENRSGLDTEHSWSEAFLSHVHKRSGLVDPFRDGFTTESLIETAFSESDSWKVDFEAHKYGGLRSLSKGLKKGDLLVRNTPNGKKLDLVTKVEE